MTETEETFRVLASRWLEGEPVVDQIVSELNKLDLHSYGRAARALMGAMPTARDRRRLCVQIERTQGHAARPSYAERERDEGSHP